MILSVLFSAVVGQVLAASLNVENPHICKDTLAKFEQPIAPITSPLDGLINAVRLHCQDKHQASIDTLATVLSSPIGINSKQLTYAYILQSINFNNIGDDNSCATAKLSMAHAMNSDSPALAIRAELNYFSFCNVYDDNTQHALKRLYELNQLAAEMNSPSLQLVTHNQLSFVYYMLDQNQLSAEEAEKALLLSEQIGADDYLVTLFNLVDAYLDAGELSLAAQRILLYGDKLPASPSDFEQYLYHYAKSYLAYLQGDFAQVLAIRDAYFLKTDYRAPSFEEKLAVLTGLSCAQLSQFDCVAGVIEQHFAQYLTIQSMENISRLGLLELLIHWHTHQQDHLSLAKVHQAYFNLANNKLIRQQQATKVLGVAKLNNEVIRLNSEEVHKQLAVQQQTTKNYRIMLSVAVVLLIIVLLAYLQLRRKISQQLLRISELK